MDEIRFNSPTRPQVPAGMPPPNPKTKRSFKKIFIIGVIILLLAALFVLFKFSGGVNLSSDAGVINLARKADPSASSYYAVFLANSQVYFGEISENNTNEMVLTNAYRMQPSGQTYNLIKLSDEAYGSTNKIFINRNQILFYEQLRSDSPVVKLIEQQGR